MKSLSYFFIRFCLIIALASLPITGAVPYCFSKVLLITSTNLSVSAKEGSGTEGMGGRHLALKDLSSDFDNLRPLSSSHHSAMPPSLSTILSCLYPWASMNSSKFCPEGTVFSFIVLLILFFMTFLRRFVAFLTRLSSILRRLRFCLGCP